MQPDTLQTLLHYCKILLDEDRLRILGFLANQPGRVREIAASLNLAESAVSRHLVRLRETGLVSPDPPNDRGVYQLDLESLHAIKKEFARLEQVNVPALEDESPTDKVLNSFLDGERLTEIPAKQTKRIVILEWVAGKFEVGVNYPERTVNEMLKRHHPDYAYLRRLLVDYRLMQRKSGIYWRVVDDSGQEVV